MEITKDIKSLFDVACQTSSTVLITGETGTGKSYLAREIHQNSSRSQKTFVSVNLASLHEGTLESELFGHERGAFTGADQKRIGKLELAQGGTVFLDEIGELPPKLQARLLEFLQSCTISPIGSNREIELDVRVIAATHHNLERSIAKREFRMDLYHRLRVIYFNLKSLRTRREELDSLIQECLEQALRKHGSAKIEITPKALEKLERYSWPGNIRELKNALEYASLVALGKNIDVQHLPAWMFEEKAYYENEAARAFAVLGVAEVPLTLDYRATFAHFEKEYILRALSRYGGKINRTARQIGLNKTTLIRRLRAYGIHPGHREPAEQPEPVGSET